MKIFVTGGTGFIGRCAAGLLLRRGHTLLLLSRNISADKKNMPKRRRLSFITGDLDRTHAWEAKVVRWRPDAALHLAWEGIRGHEYGAAISLKNLRCSLNALEVCRKAKCKKIVAAGSCLEYGRIRGKLSETMRSEPKRSFPAAKNALREMGNYLAAEGGPQFISARLFFVYGPGQRPGGLLPHLLRRFRNGETPGIENPAGANDYVYVEDVAQALTALLEKKIAGRSSLYNVGSGRLTANQHMVNIVYGRRQTGIPKRPAGFYADISKIASKIGWRPKIRIAAGIQKTQKY